jgi:hypothetical protein
MSSGPDRHRYFEDLALAHVVGGLQDPEGRVFRAHLLECGDCRARVGELRAIAHELADVERDERRVRAAKAIETKRRESDDEDLDDEDIPGSARSSRVVVIVGLVLLMLLSAWNFTLRGKNVELVSRLEDAGQAMGIIEFGDPWTVTHEDGVQGTVRERDGRLVVLVENADPDEVYGVYVLTATKEVVGREVVASEDGRVRVLISRPDGAATLVVTDPSGETLPGPTPSGSFILEAKVPQSA